MTFPFHEYQDKLVYGDSRRFALVWVGDTGASEALWPAIWKSHSFYGDKKRELDDLPPAPTSADVAGWNDRIDEISVLLDGDATSQGLRARLVVKNGEYLDAVSQAQRVPQAMPLLRTDAAGMRTHGAHLGFMQPLESLQAIEGAEGCVRLHYFTQDGRMGRTRFDTTADHRNQSFEEWLPDRLPVAVALGGNKGQDPVPTPVTVPPEVFALVDQEITIEFWAQSWQRAARNSNAVLLSARNENDEELIGVTLPSFDQDNVMGVRFKAGPDANDERFAFVSLSLVEWAHWAFTRNADGRLRMFLNGCELEPMSGGELRTGSLAGITGCALGDAPDSPWRGLVAELRIWNVALTAAEIESNRKCVLNGYEPGLVAYYPFTEGTGTTARDHTRRGRDLVDVPADAWAPSTVPIDRLDHRVLRFQSNGYVTSTTADEPYLPGRAYLIEAWVRPRKSGQTGTLVRTTANPDPTPSASPTMPYTKLGLVNGVLSASQMMLSASGGSELQVEVSDPEGELPAHRWTHVALEQSYQRKIVLLRDGKTVATGSYPEDVADYSGRSISVGHESHVDLAEIRIWSNGRGEAGIQQLMNVSLLPSVQGSSLRYYLGYDHAGAVVDLVSGEPAVRKDGGPQSVVVQDLPVGSWALIGTEYRSVTVAPGDRKKAVLRRCLAYPKPASGGVEVLADRLVGELDLRWIGNTPLDPTILGYIESAPPVPSENLTVEGSLDYNGATAVELRISDIVERTIAQEQGVSTGKDRNIDLGSFNLGIEASGGLVAEIGADLLDVSISPDVWAGSSSKSTTNIAEAEASSAATTIDRLELRGNPEPTVRFPHLGQRFIPKNVGCALIQTMMGDVFITRIRGTGKMIGYDVLPAKGIPVDVSTVTFLVNPAYAMTGSLDGLTGSSAASQRFYGHVPEMRSRFGSRYPASFFRIDDAYEEKRKVEALDKEREAYFANFNSKELIPASFEFEEDGFDQIKDILNNVFGIAADASTLIRDRIVDFASKLTGGGTIEALSSGDVKGAATSFVGGMAGSFVGGLIGGGPSIDPEAIVNAILEHLTVIPLDRIVELIEDVSALPEAIREAESSIGARRQEIKAEHKRHQDRIKEIMALDGFETWQSNMKSRWAQAQKQDIVNTYVWDADGGLCVEAQEFASTFEQSFGTGWNLDTVSGLEGSVAVAGLGFGLSMTDTTQMTSRGPRARATRWSSRSTSPASRASA
ncbi:MAG: LamG domain-containing protein [bacterium]|nr:LamG domain-containing protein [bacterium]